MSSEQPLVIGYTLCFGLMGALAVQAYIYFTRFKDDRRAIKAFVTIVLLLETLMTALVFWAFWTSSESAQYDLGPFTMTGIPAPTVLASVTGAVTTLTHGFYCWRISTLQKSRLVPFLIMMVSLLQLASIITFACIDGLSLLTGTISVNLSTLSSFQFTSYSLSPWLMTWLGSSATCDLAIAICMVLALRPSQSYFANNKSTLVKLTRLSIETGLVTTVAALLELILALLPRLSSYHFSVFYAISKLYANCLLASLNFRHVLRSQSDPSLTAIVWDDMASNTQSRQSGFQPPHTGQNLAWVETDIDMVVDLNETGPRKNDSSEDQTCEMYEPDGPMRV